MNAARGHIVHAMRGRVRLRIPSMKGDETYFERVEQVLNVYEGVHYVRVNPLTASVLIKHGTDADSIASYLTEKSLVQLVPSEDGAGLAMDTVSHQIGRLDRSIQQKTNHSLDLTSVAFATLLGVGVYQLFKGQILGKASTFFLYAASLAGAHYMQDKNPAEQRSET